MNDDGCRDMTNRIGIGWVMTFGLLLGLPGGIAARSYAQPKPTLRFILPGAPTPRVSMAIPLPSPVNVPSHWWNRVQMIESLQLTPDQRRQMDTTIAVFERQISASQLEQNAARQRFDAALKAANWEAARVAAGDWEQALAKGWGLQNRAKIDVIQHLTREQHDQLWLRHTEVIERPWTAARGLNEAPAP